MTYDWRDDAACIGKGHLFHAPEGEQYHARAKREAAALAICATCPVIAECARLVATDRDIYTHAVAAGMTPAMRGIRVGGGSRIPARRATVKAFTDDERESIRAQYARGRSTTRIARDHDTDTSTVSKVCADLRDTRAAALERTTA